MMTSVDIRQAFLDFFVSKGHSIVPSSSIVVKNDPTLLFTNAGMNQFKDYFLGNKTAPHQRVADTQKCLRVSGKHNDLEEVGVDTYHHTMFEMLGNWSFGDPARTGGYFKKEAIAWSWELLTAVYRIPKERLYVTVFEGDQKENLPVDEEAIREWKTRIDENRIVMGNKKDNFWEMGDTGPCGPCTEIHVDCRTEEERCRVDGKQLVNKDHPQVIEIWNNVFIQFNRLKDGSLEPLPSRHVDTGMGLERLVRVLQQKQSNYDTDIFSGTLAAIEEITDRKYGRTDSKPDIAFRVLADHIRAIAFTIADGQLPSNTGAGYVIRRILRRAVRYYYSYLDYKQPLLYRLAPVLAKQFRHVFPELEQQLDFVSKVVREEEEAFLRTLERGLKRIDDMLQQGTSRTDDSTPVINGKEAFELYDTFGFPIDLTRLIAAENNYRIDEAGFTKEMQQQKDRSRAAGILQTEDWIVVNEGNATKFVGYDTLEADTMVTRYRKINNKGKQAYQLVLSTTPFYAESGGQVGDTGVLLIPGEQQGVLSLDITDTKKENDLVVHYTDALPQSFPAGVTAKVDAVKRQATAIHHTATHLLHAALRTVLGKHVAQKGSLVNEAHLRFDFSHFARLTAAEISRIEDLVNRKIRANIPVVIKEMPKEEALALGAMALFGEKYGDRVRVVIIDPAYSVELCGGTHAGATGELGYFIIEQETAVAAGVRRIEAVSGEPAATYIQTRQLQLQQVKEQLKNPKDLLKSIETLAAENAALHKQLEKLEAKQLSALAKELAGRQELINGIPFIGQVVVDVPNADALKKLFFLLKNELTVYVITLAANTEGKAAVAIGMDDATAAARQLKAPAIIREHIAPLIKGGGGGQPTFATAGGQETGNLQEVVDAVRRLLSEP